MRLYPAQLRADFQHYYGLNLDGMGTEYTVLHAADLAACLPHDSRTGIAEDPSNEWTIDRQLLALIELYAHVWVWWHTKEGKRKVNVPKLRMPGADGSGILDGGMTADEMLDFMENLISKEETEGGGDVRAC